MDCMSLMGDDRLTCEQQVLAIFELDAPEGLDDGGIHGGVAQEADEHDDKERRLCQQDARRLADAGKPHGDLKWGRGASKDRGWG